MGSLPDSQRYPVPGADKWQYVVTNMTNSTWLVYNNVWLDTRPSVHDTPALRVNFIMPYDMYKRDDIDLNSTIPHIGYIKLLNKIYKLKGQVVRYGHSKCYGNPERAYFCRHVIMFRIPFVNVTEQNWNDFLDRRFVYLVESHQALGIDLDIQIPVQGEKKGRFFVCCKPLYGVYTETQLRHLVEWVEMNKLLGIKQIHIYNSSMTPTEAFNRVFDYYRHKGTMFLHHLGNPLSGLATEVKSSELLQPAALNDCLYTNMYSYDYVLVIDVDELFIPVEHTTLDQLFDDYVEAHSNLFHRIVSISSPWAFYYTEENEVVNTSKVLELTQIFSYPTARGKAITKTWLCPYLGQHACAVDNQGYRNKYKLPFSVARVHHYRSKCKWPLMCDPDTLETGVNYTDRYRIPLQSTLHKLYELFNI